MSKRGLVNLGVCFLVVFIGFAIRYNYSVLLPEMLPSLGISKTEAGIVFSSYFVAYTVLSPVAGLLTDKIDIRVILSFFLCLLSLGTFLIADSSSLVGTSFFFVIAGIGASACWPAVVALAQRWVSDKYRGTALAIIDTGASLGGVIISLTMPVVVAAFSWRMGWTLLGTLAFLIAFLARLLVQSSPDSNAHLPHKKRGAFARYPIKSMYVKVLKVLRFWLIGLSYFLIGFSVLIPFTFINTYAVQELKLSYEGAAKLVTMIAVAGMAGKLVLGLLSDALGRVRIMIFCGALIALCSFGMAYEREFIKLSLITIIYGFSRGAIFPLYAACASDYFPKEFVGTIVGIWALFFGIGSILAPVIAGWTADITGTLTWSFILATATAMLSLFLLLPAGKAFVSTDLLRNQDS